MDQKQKIIFVYGGIDWDSYPAIADAIEARIPSDLRDKVEVVQFMSTGGFHKYLTEMTATDRCFVRAIIFSDGMDVSANGIPNPKHFYDVQVKAIAARYENPGASMAYLMQCVDFGNKRPQVAVLALEGRPYGNLDDVRVVYSAAEAEAVCLGAIMPGRGLRGSGEKTL